MPAPESIADKAIKGAKWTYMGTVARIAAQFIGQIALSRFLGPESVGLFAYAFLLVSLTTLFLEMGLGSALVQHKNLTDEAIGIVNSRLMLTATAGAILQFLLADEIATVVFSNPYATHAIRAMAWTYPLNAIAVPLIAACRRQMAFKELQKAQMFAYMIAYLVVGIIAAKLGAGIWALITAWYANLVLQVVLLKQALRLASNYRNPLKSTGLESFGLVITTTNIINWTSDNLAPFIVGRHFGSAPLGAYNTGNNLVRTPANHLVTSLQQVLFAAVSRVQNKTAIAAQAYKLAASLVLMISIPIFGYVALTSEQIVAVLFGEAWGTVATILPALSLAMIPHVLMAIAGPILAARGTPATEMKIQFISVIFTGALLFALTSSPLPALVWGVFAGYALRAMLITYSAFKALEMNIKDAAVSFIAPIASGTLFIVVAAATLEIASALTSHQFAQLLLSAITATILSCAAITIIPRHFLSPEIAWLILRITKNHNNPHIARLTAHSKKPDSQAD